MIALTSSIFFPILISLNASSLAPSESKTPKYPVFNLNSSTIEVKYSKNTPYINYPRLKDSDVHLIILNNLTIITESLSDISFTTENCKTVVRAYQSSNKRLMWKKCLDESSAITKLDNRNLLATSISSGEGHYYNSIIFNSGTGSNVISFRGEFIKSIDGKSLFRYDPMILRNETFPMYDYYVFNHTNGQLIKLNLTIKSRTGCGVLVVPSSTESTYPGNSNELYKNNQIFITRSDKCGDFTTKFDWTK